jgi:peptidoglycan hydrolase CwlO-like protein
MGKIEDLEAAVQTNAQEFAAAMLRIDADFQNLKAQIAEGKNIDAALDRMQATISATNAALKAVDPDPLNPAAPPTA